MPIGQVIICPYIITEQDRPRTFDNTTASKKYK